MSDVWRTAIRNITSHKLRLLTTGLAIMLGVGFAAGTLVFTDTIQRTFDNLFADVYAHTDAVVRAESSFDNPNGFVEERGRVDESLVEQVRAVEGVVAAEGNAWGYAQLVDRAGEPIGNPMNGPPTVGSNWMVTPELNSWELVAGRAPAGPGEVVVDKKSADAGPYAVGDTAPVLAKGGVHQVQIVGVARFGGADSPGGASFTLFTLPDAQRLVTETGMVDAISVVARPGVSQEELVSRLDAAIPAGTEAVTGKVITEENQDAIRRGLSFFSRFMLVFAIVGLLVGGFMIFNAFFITVAQRTRENALLRALGASKRQVLGAVLGEALVVGVIASAAGLVFGVAVAAGLKALLAGFGIDIPAGGIVFTRGTAITALAAGVVVTMAAAISPARKAGKVPPIAAMRDVATGSVGYGSKQRIVVGSALLALGIAALFYGLFGSPSNALAVVGGGVLLTFFAVAALGRTISLPLSRLLGAPFPRLRGIAGRMARENAMRNPKRTAATASALMIGVGLVGFITIFAASAKASFDATVDRAFSGDFVITAPSGFGSGGIDPRLAADLEARPEIEAAAGIRAGFAEIDGNATMILASGRSGFDVIDVEPLAGSPDALDAGSIAVYTDVANRKGLSLGDRVPVVFKDTGPTELTVAFIYGQDQPAGNWLLGLDAFKANFADQFDSQIFVKKAAGVDSASALAVVDREAAAYPGTKVLDQTQYKEQQTQFVDQMLGLVYAMLGLAIFIALLGIGNTLALSIMERTHELGLLRAVGMTQRQLRSSIRLESVIIALQGTLLGLAVGTFFGWSLVRALADEGINRFTLPVTSLAVVVVLGALAGVVAALLPARRAARMNVLAAIASE